MLEFFANIGIDWIYLNENSQNIQVLEIFIKCNVILKHKYNKIFKNLIFFSVKIFFKEVFEFGSQKNYSSWYFLIKKHRKHVLGLSVAKICEQNKVLKVLFIYF